MMTKPIISIIVVLYNNEIFIEPLLRSVSEQSYKNIELILVDNGSKDRTQEVILRETEKLCLNSRVKNISLSENVGFARGNNEGVKMSRGEYILFMNSDVTLEIEALEYMVGSILRKKSLKCAGIAPKIYLTKFLPERVFDSVGICMNNDASPYNRAIGQTDFGQYDCSSEEIMGCCFACALIEKKAYVQLGGLDNSYFAYFEDVDWCFRARKCGYTFYAEPKAVAFHHHSASTSKKSYSWKYYLIFRNYLRTCIKTFGKKTAIRIITRKIIDLINTAIGDKDKQIKVSALKVVVNFFIMDIWHYALYREKTRKQFINSINDEIIFGFSENEPAHFFDPVKYQQINMLDMYQFIYYKFADKTNQKAIKKWEEIKKGYYCDLNRNDWLNSYKVLLSIVKNSPQA